MHYSFVKRILVLTLAGTLMVGPASAVMAEEVATSSASEVVDETTGSEPEAEGTIVPAEPEATGTETAEAEAEPVAGTEVNAENVAPSADEAEEVSEVAPVQIMSQMETVQKVAANAKVKKKGLVQDTDKVFRLYVDGKVDTSYNGLYKDSESGKIYYLSKGVWNKSFTKQLAELNNKLYFVRDGVVDTAFTGVAQYAKDKTVRFVRDGVEDREYTGFGKHVVDGKWYYAKAGIVDRSFTGVAVCWQTGKLYIARNGKLDRTFTGFGKNPQDDKWYFVRKGVHDPKFTGIAQSIFNNKWYFARNGVLDWDYTGAGKSVQNGKWYYAKNGRLNWNYTGLGISHKTNQWYYFQKGRLNWKYTGLARINGKGPYYSVKKGCAGYIGTALLAHATSNEYGSYYGGKVGDQTGKEVYIRDWYNRPWNYVFRFKDAKKAERFAYAMERAAANDNIGYCMGTRNTLYNLAAKVGWDPGKVTKKCNTDCSALVTVALIYAGISKNVVYQYGNCSTTSVLRSRLMSTKEFTMFSSAAYTKSAANLKRGDVLLYEGHHTAAVIHAGTTTIL